MSVNLPHHFPSRAEQIYKEAREFQRLTPDERLRRMLDLIACGETMMANSPKREIARQLREKSEADWQRAFKELFTRHGLIVEPATGLVDGADRADAGA